MLPLQMLVRGPTAIAPLAVCPSAQMCFCEIVHPFISSVACSRSKTTWHQDKKSQ